MEEHDKSEAEVTLDALLAVGAISDTEHAEAVRLVRERGEGMAMRQVMGYAAASRPAT